MQINLSGPDISQAEIDAVLQVMHSTTLSLGPKLGEFESAFAKYTNRKYGVAVNSGTSALHLAMLSLGITAGDEVISTPFSFIATTNCIMMVDAKPVLVDIDPVTYNIDHTQIESKITDKTKCIIPVEVFGNPDGIDKVCDIAKKNNLYCVEDSCEALGSVINNRQVGTLGDISIFAFYPNKQITTGEGGILLTDNKAVADLCYSFRNQGRDTEGGWLAHARMGYNYRLSDISCAIGTVQLGRIDEFVKKRATVASWYNEVLKDESRLVLPAAPDNATMSWFVYVPRLNDAFTGAQRNQMLTTLRDQGVGCSNYFAPIHLQPFMVEKYGYKKGDFPVTEHIADRTMALPFYNNISRNDVEIVCQKLITALDQLKN